MFVKGLSNLVIWGCCVFICFLFLTFTDAEVIGNTLSSTDSKIIPIDVKIGKALEKDASKFNRFASGFIASIYVIIVSELGDKTFFIAAIMSIQHSRIVVYCGAMFALGLMTVLSAVLGFATNILPRVYTFYLSGVLFLLFGIKMIRDAYLMRPEDAAEEYSEVEQELAEKNNELDASLESGDSGPTTTPKRVGMSFWRRHCPMPLQRMLSPVFAEAFVLTFLAEWGDRSQVTTIILAATKDVAGVILGGVLGHALCTGLAVIAGRLVAKKIPVKWLTFIGGITFICFAFATFIGKPDSNS